MENKQPIDELESIRNEIFYFMTKYPGENDMRSYKLLGKLKEQITQYLHQHKESDNG